MVSLLSLMEGLSLVIKQLPQKALPALSPVAQLVPPNPLRVWLGPCCVLMDPRTSPWRLDNTDSPSSRGGNAGGGHGTFLSYSVPREKTLCSLRKVVLASGLWEGWEKTGPTLLPTAHGSCCPTSPLPTDLWWPHTLGSFPQGLCGHCTPDGYLRPTDPSRFLSRTSGTRPQEE